MSSPSQATPLTISPSSTPPILPLPLSSSMNIHAMQNELRNSDEIDNDSLSSSSSSTGFNTNFDQCNVFVKYLPPNLTDQGLHDLFKSYGEIASSKVMVNHQNGESLGYGFVRFSSSINALSAISGMNGHKIGNKTLLCKLSNTAPSSTPSSSPSTNLYIKPLLPTVTENDLFDLFSVYGKIVEVKVMVDKSTGQSRGIGFVRFESQAHSEAALNAMNQKKLSEDSPILTVKFAESPEQKNIRKAKAIASSSDSIDSGSSISIGASSNEKKIKSSSPKQQQQQQQTQKITKSISSPMNVSSQYTPSMLVSSVTSPVLLSKSMSSNQLSQGQTSLVPLPLPIIHQPQLHIIPHSLPISNYPSLMHPHSLPTLGTAGHAQQAINLENGQIYAYSSPPLLYSTSTDNFSVLPNFGNTPLTNASGEKKKDTEDNSGVISPPSVHDRSFQGYPPRPLPLAASLSSLSGGNANAQYISQQVRSPYAYIYPISSPLPHSISAPLVSSPSMGSVSPEPDSVSNLFCFHLPADMDSGGLYRLFCIFGPLQSVRVITDKNTGVSKGYGFVKFYKKVDAEKARVSMNGFRIANKHLKVEFKALTKNGRSPPS